MYCPVGNKISEQLQPLIVQLIEHMASCPQCRQAFLESKDSACLELLLLKVEDENPEGS